MSWLLHTVCWLPVRVLGVLLLSLHFLAICSSIYLWIIVARIGGLYGKLVYGIFILSFILLFIYPSINPPDEVNIISGLSFVITGLYLSIKVIWLKRSKGVALLVSPVLVSCALELVGLVYTSVSL